MLGVTSRSFGSYWWLSAGFGTGWRHGCCKCDFAVFLPSGTFDRNCASSRGEDESVGRLFPCAGDVGLVCPLAGLFSFASVNITYRFIATKHPTSLL